MRRWVALLRAVNVGGSSKLPMADLRRMAEALGWQQIATYIASGNLLFSADGTADAHAEALQHRLEADCGLKSRVIVLSDASLRHALAACPFDPEEGKHVHLLVLDSDPTPDDALIESLRAPSEEVRITGRVVYLHAPQGVGRSRLAARLERAVGATGTARNLATVKALVAML